MNHLYNEKSPYLLQHAENPVHWFPWGDDALEKARQEQKPIFISIGYSTCHWCHVMAHESFEDLLVAEKLNKNFISIKVDREERPDIDAGFMHACQLLNGHGGWPLNLFLTPEARPFYALTYAPKQTRGQHLGFIDIVDRIAELWQQQPSVLIDNGKQLSEAMTNLEQQQANTAAEENILGLAAEKFKQLYDREYSGFGSPPKFPQPHNLSILLRLAQRFNDSDLQQIALQTLQHIDQGGITDQLGGGIHRYSVDKSWLVPHFEKMLYDQALISMAYLEAWQTTNQHHFKQAAENTLDYALRELRHDEGGFYCGEDADSEGAEGTYYLWAAEELAEALTTEENKLLVDSYNVTVEGHFEGKNILHRKSYLTQSADSNAKLEKIRSNLLQIRNRRPHPHLDDKILTGWNGLMIASLAKAGSLLHNSNYLVAAEKAVSFLQDRLMVDGRLKRRYRDKETLIDAFHEDFSFFIHGLIELFLAGFNSDHLKLALSLTEQCKRLFNDGHGGYYDSAEPFADGQGRGRTKQDGAIPAAGSITAHNLIRLARLTGQYQLEEQALELLRSTLLHADKYPTSFASLLQALDLALTEQLTLAIILPKTEKELSENWSKALQPLRHQLLTVITATPEEYTGTVPFVADKTVIEGKVTAWICTGTSCQTPITKSSELERQLQTHAPLNTFSK